MAQLPPSFAKFEVASGLNPITLVEAPDGILYLVEKDGRILQFEDDKLLEDPFFSIPVSVRGERGLLGFALHPEFETNGYFYVFYNRRGVSASRLSRFRVGSQAEKVIFEVHGITASHIGGAIHFGLDHKLYVAVGDNYDPDNAQKLDNIFGKILRFNADGSIPDDNPFYLEAEGLAKSIWALGFRNPFTFAVDEITGKIFANDVGNAKWEEINDIEKGMNYGWSFHEGWATAPSELANYRDPLYAYDHETGCSIVGGDFYPEGGSFPSLYHDKYFFVDYCGGFINVLDPGTGEVVETFESNITRPLSVLFASNGALYYLERGEGAGDGSAEDVSGSLDGSLWKVVYNPEGHPIVSKDPKSTIATVGEDAEFRTTAMGLTPLSFQWYRNDNPISGATEPFLQVPNVTLADSAEVFHCVVSNSVGEVSTDTVQLTVTSNKRPVPQIMAPLAGATYSGGQQFLLSAEAVDPEDGKLAESSLVWWVDFHHNTHTHPAMAPRRGNNISFTITQKGEVSENVWYRVYVSATDSEGLGNVTYVDIAPRISEIRLESNHPGAEIRIEDEVVTTPYTLRSVEGIIRRISVALTQQIDGEILNFVQWSDSIDQSNLTITTPPADSVIVASFTKNGVYPNPVQDYLILEFNAGQDVAVTYSILSMDGKPLIRGVTELTSTDFRRRIDVQTLARGQYLMVVDSPFGKESYTIIKQ